MIGYIEENQSFADNRLHLPESASIFDLEKYSRSQLEWLDQVLSYNHIPKDLIPQIVTTGLGSPL